MAGHFCRETAEGFAQNLHIIYHFLIKMQVKTDGELYDTLLVNLKIAFHFLQ